jgi:hypothetical protein
MSSVVKTSKPSNSWLHSDITKTKIMKQSSFKNAECSVQNNISTFCQVADQLL